MRVYDVLRASESLQSELSSEPVALVGEGIGAVHALYAAVVDRAVAAVDLRELGPSFYEMATNRTFPLRPQLTVFDVLEDCDIPHLEVAPDAQGVTKARR